MLTELSVRHFAIVDELLLRWEDGFTVITGETGAGKSIIVDAIGALVGGRVNADMVQAGAARATLEGVFDPHAESMARAEITALLDEHGIELEDDPIILTREIATGSGRGVTRINGRAVPLSLLQRVGEWLVDLHGQSEHLSLLRAREQLELLDRYARLIPTRQRMAASVRELRRVRAERTELDAEVRRARREEAILRHEVGELEAAQLDPNEEAELQSRRQRLRNAERLQSALTAAAGMLGGEEDRSGAMDLASQAATHLRDAARYDDALATDAESLEAAAAQLGDVMMAVSGAMDRLAAESGELESVEERVLALADLKRKYGGTLEDLIAYLEQSRERLTRLERHDTMLEELSAREAELLVEAAAVAAELGQRRAAAAQGLSVAVQEQLDDLGLRGARLQVRLVRETKEDGLPLSLGSEAGTFAFDDTGVERAELLFAPNPGEPPRPLARIASGGELARVSLAIKTVLSQVDTRATLIFDEVDMGVGGRSAGVVGEKLWGLTDHHQVLCITHMPQVAAFADHHLHVQKSAAEEKTEVAVIALQLERRTTELAAMLTGSETGVASLASAQELIDRAADYKHRVGEATGAQV